MENKQKNHFLSLIIPVYRQEKTIISNLHQVRAVLNKIRYDYEIIAVIDGMIDESYKKIKEADIPKVKAIAYETNQGKSYAIQLGMREAVGDYVMFMDSGMEIDPNGISMLLEHMEWYDADIIVGSKRHPASFVNYSLMRKILSNGYYFFVKTLFGIQIHDTQAGIKIFRKNVLEKILPRLVEKKFAGDLEMLVVASSLGFKKIYEAPIKMDYNMGFITSAATLKSIVGIFMDTLAIFYRKAILHHYNKENNVFFYPKELKVVRHSEDKNINKLEDERTHMKNPMVSVVIPVKQMGYYVIFENLPAFEKLQYDNFEVIVLPNEHAQYDIELLKKYKWLRIIPTGKITRPAEKRDMGVKEAKGEIIAFIDDDAYPTPEWLTNAVQAFTSQQVAAVAGPGELPPRADFWEKVFDEVLKTFIGSGGYSYRFTKEKERYVDDYPTMNFLIKKDVFEKIGGFNNDFWPGEDSKLCNDLVHKLGEKIFYDPTVTIYHHRRKDLAGYLKQHDNYGFHRGAFFAHGDQNSRRLEYLAPTAFIVYLAIFTIFLLIANFTNLVTNVNVLLAVSLPFLLYLWGMMYLFFQSLFHTQNIKVALASMYVLLMTHVRYGIMFAKGFVTGLVKKEKIYSWSA